MKCVISSQAKHDLLITKRRQFLVPVTKLTSLGPKHADSLLKSAKYNYRDEEPESPELPDYGTGAGRSSETGSEAASHVATTLHGYRKRAGEGVQKAEETPR